MTYPMLWNLVKLIDGSDSLCVLLPRWDDLGMAASWLLHCPRSTESLDESRCIPPHILIADAVLF